ncbi:protein argonaute-2-like isoform X2 [Acropora muricata]|uniref:protein argonaute-2-like isoform X2 n=1 Tax=Acropora muricata TaxID=159855 RepID=UPI0034E3E593
MPRKPKGRGNRGRGRGNNGQDHQQPRPGRSENGISAIVSDREEKQNLDGEGSDGTVKETAAPSQRTSRSQESADKAHSKEHKSEEKNAISSKRSQDERPGPNEISLTPETASFVKPATNAEKCEQRHKSWVVSHTSEDSRARKSSSSSVHPPKRPGFGTVGRPIDLRANFFRLSFSPKLTCLYHYDVEITPSKCPKAVKSDVVNAIVRNNRDTFRGHEPGFDGEKNLISFIQLPSPVQLKVTLPGVDGGKDRKFQVKIQFAKSVNVADLKDFLSGKQNGKTAQHTVQALNIVLRQMPSNHFTPIGRLFFPMNHQSIPIGEGCEVKFGFFQSVRPSEWKVMLVNLDVSAKVFYKSQPVTEFVCETLGVRDLEDRNIRIDKEKLKKAIYGVRIETTHIRRKYTVWGVSNLSAEKLQFEIGDEASTHRTKTTVARYFFDKYSSELRYPHLPCLQVGQKKERFLPMEVCTIIPCRKRSFSKREISDMIRSTARPAPERQKDIQRLAQEMTTRNKQYLKDQFQASIDPKMVSVQGRVLPAPQLKLGPQDKALIPRDGTWDMRNQSLFKSARVDMWALVSFARCNKDHLRNFCEQMSSVSKREGMKMAAQPAVVTFGRRPEEVERLFFDCLEQFPALQLIMVVLPGNDKKLYSEVKRVGDRVIGIPIQCVQVKLVLQAKPQVCANISLKINAKLGGTNHVIDYSATPVFNEPTIVFGADVTHPSPTENGIPSIAAVVASMDYHAAKYHACVRAQTHRNGGYAQEIIIDLAEIVRELLIEFYKTNRHLRPSQILFYRDGVGEGQFDQVLVHEVRAVQEACMKLQEDYRPRITFVVVQKRHHTRLFCENDRDASGKARNVPPGTTVDSGITHPYEFDFYLCSHYGIQGTSRPMHYHVLYDDNNFTSDSLQQLTYQLCHVFARCTRSVFMPAPAYYAHLAASRARVHATNRNSGSVDLEECARAIEVNDKMKGSMYFT